MKELSIEEKAKAYDEAIEALCSLFAKQAIKHCDRVNIKDITNIFPELKESEDERIRKSICNVIENGFALREDKHRFFDDYSQEQMIAWLEKQGDKTNPYSGVSFEYNGHTWGMCARDNGVDILLDKQLFKHLEKQGEQKSAWSEEDEDTIKFLISHFCTCHPTRTFQFTINEVISHDELLRKIRHLSPQSNWKPSIAQLNALSIVSKGNAPDDIEAIQSLYNDLKKLRE